MKLNDKNDITRALNNVVVALDRVGVKNVNDDEFKVIHESMVILSDLYNKIVSL